MPAISARAWVSTIGSLSTYTTLACGSACWAISWVLPAVGMPVPMSRNWSMPCSATCRTARCRKPRLDRAVERNSGFAESARSAASRSAGKLSFPPR